MNLRLVGDQCEGTITLQQDEVRLVSHVAEKLGGSRVQDRIDSALFSINSLDTQVHLAGDLERPTVRLESNVGAALAQGINGAIDQELHFQQEKLVARADMQLAAERQRFDAFIDKHQRELVQKLNANESSIRQFQDLLAERFGGTATRSAQRLLQSSESINNLIFK